MKVLRFRFWQRQSPGTGLVWSKSGLRFLSCFSEKSMICLVGGRCVRFDPRSLMCALQYWHVSRGLTITQFTVASSHKAASTTSSHGFPTESCHHTSIRPTDLLITPDTGVIKLGQVLRVATASDGRAYGSHVPSNTDMSAGVLQSHNSQ